ncbi:MAG: hypothetical protein WCT27_05020 [Patescibacteria group bacterium]
MNLPITPLIDLANSLICAVCAYQLYRSWRLDRNNSVLLYFAQGYTSLVFSYFLFSVPRLVVPENSFVLGIGFVLAQAFLYGSVAYFAKVSVFFLRRQWVRPVFFAVVAVSIIAIALNIIFFNHPTYNPVNSMTDWDIHPVVSILSTLIFTGVLFPSAVFFYWQGHRSKDPVVHNRSIGLSIGLALLIVTAYTYYTAETPIIVYISDILSLMSYLVIFLFVIYRRQSLPHDNQINKPNNI